MAIQRYGVFLFVDIEESVSVSSHTKYGDYEDMLDEYISIGKDIPDIVRKNYSEYDFLNNSNINLKMTDPLPHGDELFFSIHIDYEIEKEDVYQPYLNRAVFLTLVTAIELKKKWYRCKTNINMVKDGRPRIELACGIHCGRVSDKTDNDGDSHGGYHIGLGKRTETISRIGKYSHIVVSSEAYDALMAHNQPAYSLKQKLFFEHVANSEGVPKGISSSHCFHELKFFTRLWVDEIVFDEQESAEENDTPEIGHRTRPFREKFWEYNVKSEELLKNAKKT